MACIFLLHISTTNMTVYRSAVSLHVFICDFISAPFFYELIYFILFPTDHSLHSYFLVHGTEIGPNPARFPQSNERELRAKDGGPVIFLTFSVLYGFTNRIILVSYMLHEVGFFFHSTFSLCYNNSF